MTAALRRHWKFLFGLGLVVGATILLFAPVLDFDFLNYDDPYLIHGNAILFRDLGFATLFKPIAGLYHPLTTLSLWTDLHLFGGEARVFHLSSLAIHAGATVALGFWLWRFSSSLFVTLFLTAAFAFHPTHVESVAWISERKDVLSALFFWLCLLFHDFAAQERSRGWWALCFAAAILSLMAKPFALTLPLLLPFLEWARTDFRENAGALLRRRRFSVAAFAGLAIAAGLANLSAQAALHGTPAADAGAFLRLPQQIVFYLGKTLWPQPLQIVYANADLLSLPVAAGALIFALLFAWIWRRSRVDILFGLGFFTLTILPMLKLVGFGDASPVSDRYLYVAQTGLWWPVARELARLFETNRTVFRKVAAATVASALAVFWWIASDARLPDWRDGQALWRSQLEADPSSKIAHDNLGRDFSSRERLFEALSQFEQGDTEKTENLINRAQILLRFQRLIEADALIKEAEAKSPSDIDVRIARGDYLVMKNELEPAMRIYQAALDSPLPESVSTAKVRALTSLGMLAIRKGDFQACLNWQDQALALLPHFANALYNRALCLLNLNRLDEAEAGYRRLLSLHPQFPIAYNDLGVIALKRGNIPQARANFEHALQMDPNLAIARKNRDGILR